MTEKIVGLLEQLEKGRFWPMPAQPGALEAFEAELGERLPDDIRQVFTRWGGGSVTVPGLTPLGFGPVGELLDFLDDPDYNEYMPEMVIVGGTGGGYLYFYDPRNHLGRGHWWLYLISMGDLRLPTAIPVAASATEALERLLNGAEFMDAPEIGGEIDI
jgi:hypothetical protein